MLRLKSASILSARRRSLLRGLSSSAAASSTARVQQVDDNSSSSSTAKQHALYPHLFTPLDLGPAGVLPNRVLMGSMHTGRFSCFHGFHVFVGTNKD
jgi:hypothetical protein